VIVAQVVRVLVGQQRPVVLESVDDEEVLMRAIVNTPGGPSRVEQRDVPEPVPDSDEVLVAVEAFSLNRGELALLAARPPGWQPGQDVAGTVLVPAADGSGPPTGARVAALVDGAGWAERVAVPVRRLAVLPGPVDIAAAATLGVAGRTALRTVALGGSLLGRRVLVTAAAGGVGRFQVQLAAAAGAEVVAVSRRTRTATALLDLGAADVVERTADAEGLFDLVLDGVGGRQLTQAVDKVAADGAVVLIGASDPEPAPLNLLDFTGHENATITSYFSYAQPDTVSTDLATLVGLIARGQLKPHLGLHEPWTSTDSALETLAAGHVDGKAVLDVPHPNST